jgi:hypothetical protein
LAEAGKRSPHGRGCGSFALCILAGSEFVLDDSKP